MGSIIQDDGVKLMRMSHIGYKQDGLNGEKHWELFVITKCLPNSKASFIVVQLYVQLYYMVVKVGL